jgi:hypothetical protein
LLGEETQVDDGIFWDQTTGLREHGWTQKPSPSIAPFSRMDIHNPSTYTHKHTLDATSPMWIPPIHKSSMNGQCEFHVFTNHGWSVDVNTTTYSKSWMKGWCEYHHLFPIMDEVLMWIPPPPIPNHGWSVDVNTTTYSQSWMKGWCEYHPPPIKGWQTEPSYGGYHI